MDTKSEGVNKTKYLTLKQRYHNKTISKKSKGTECKIAFIETERCIELWFLFHFSGLITRKFDSCKEIEKELRKFRPQYQKDEKYFKSLGNIHKHLIEDKPQGSLEKAVENARKSIKSRKEDEREYTYSEMHLLFEALGIIE